MQAPDFVKIFNKLRARRELIILLVLLLAMANFVANLSLIHNSRFKIPGVLAGPLQDNSAGTYFDTFSDASGVTLSDTKIISGNIGLDEVETSDSFSEDFDDTTYKDSTYTTALWDTTTGRVTLSSLNPKTDLGSGGDIMLIVTIGDGDNDGQNEVYAANFDGYIYQFKWTNAGWSKTNLGYAGWGAIAVAVGDGDNDGSNEVYGGCSDYHLYQFKWTGTAWNKTDLGEAGGDQIYGIAIGDGDNTGQNNEVYVANRNKHVYQFKWTGSAWNKTDLGEAGQVLYGIGFGDGDNDAENEIYATGRFGHLYQYKWNGSSWDITEIGTAGSNFNQTEVADGNNDGEKEVYATSTDNHVYQFKWNGLSYDKTDLGSPEANVIAGLAVGDGDNDGRNEVYVGSRPSSNGHLYQLEWNESFWDITDLGTFGTKGIDALAVGDADNNGSNEIYVSNDDYHLYQFSFGYLSPRTAQSASLISLQDGKIVSATLTASSTIPASTAISYSLSADGGSNWESVSSGSEHSFTNTGTDLRWKAELSTSASTSTPVIDELAIDYTIRNYISQGIAYSSLITPSEVGDYEKVDISHTLNSQSIKYYLLDSSGNLIPDSELSGNSSGFNATSTSITIDLSSINAATYSSLKIKAVLSTSAFVTPTVNDWKVYWIKAKAKGNNQEHQVFISSGDTVNFDGTSSIGTGYNCQWYIDPPDGVDWENPGISPDSSQCSFTSAPFTTYGAHEVVLRTTQGAGGTAVDTDMFNVVVPYPGGGIPMRLTPSRIELEASPEKVKATGQHTSVITARVFDPGDIPMAGEWVDFEILEPAEELLPFGKEDKGTFSETKVLTDDQGYAQTRLTSGKSLGRIKIRAKTGNISQEKELTLVRPLIKLKIFAKIERP